MRENECENIRVNLLYFHTRIAAADTGKACSRITAFCGALWHHGVSKRGRYFSWAPGVYCFRIFRNIATIVCENSCSRSELFVCATIFAPFSLPIQKFLYQLFAKGTLRAHCALQLDKLVNNGITRAHLA